MTEPQFPALTEEWEPTRATLHAYAHGITAIPRALAPAHPKWWHASLRVRPTGLVSDIVPIPTGGTLQFRLDLVRAKGVLEASDGRSWEHGLTDGVTGTEFADAVIAAAADLGVGGEVARDKFENDEPRAYDPGHAGRFWRALTAVSTVMERHRRSLDGPVGPAQLWPHNFDLSFEWFGSRTIRHEEDGETTLLPAQINFGFYPKGDAYFYANPWPFDPALTARALPSGAQWHTDGWEGTMLPYAALAGHADGPERLLDFYSTVHSIAAPTLME